MLKETKMCIITFSNYSSAYMKVVHVKSNKDNPTFKLIFSLEHYYYYEIHISSTDSSDQ
jgi:hypothetical protein